MGGREYCFLKCQAKLVKQESSAEETTLSNILINIWYVCYNLSTKIT